MSWCCHIVADRVLLLPYQFSYAQSLLCGNMHTHAGPCSQHAAFKAHTPHAAVCRCATSRLPSAKVYHRQQNSIHLSARHPSIAHARRRHLHTFVVAGNLVGLLITSLFLLMFGAVLHAQARGMFWLDHTQCVLQESGDCTLVVGATGGVGQVLTGKLLDVGAKQVLLTSQLTLVAQLSMCFHSVVTKSKLCPETQTKRATCLEMHRILRYVS